RAGRAGVRGGRALNRSLALAFFVLAWLASLAVLAPMRWLGELDLWRNAGLSASGASGTIWNGRLLGLDAGSQPLGDVDAALSAASLLTGTVAIEFATDGSRGKLLLGRERGLRAVSGEWPLVVPTPGGPLQWALSLDAVSAVVRGGTCAEAAGGLEAVLTLPAAGSTTPPLVLSGTPVCREGVVEASLMPAPGSPAVELLVQIRADGQYRLVWLARDPDPGLRAALDAAGFIAGADGLSRVDEGSLAGAVAAQR
ncbi:MAG: type II secretion system protein N, partial [Arenimonas sp.]|uniref:type II secretion system protein N n=1 Tax=Arenimonas sp. TaxID=1872635 RepID=UPI0025BE94DE